MHHDPCELIIMITTDFTQSGKNSKQSIVQYLNQYTYSLFG